MAPQLTPLLAALDVAAIRVGLERGGVQGALAGMRLVNEEYDRSIELDRLLRPLAAGDDLRFVWRDAGQERWVLAERLAWDSEFFGRGLGRLHAVVAPSGAPGRRDDVTTGQAALVAVLKEARTRGIVSMVATVQATDLPALRTLTAAGFELIETRLIYHRPLLVPPVERAATRLARVEDIPSLAEAAATTINPFDRFHADVTVSSDEAARLMRQWVTASIADGFADATIVPDEPAPEAFCTAKLHREHWDGWGVRLAQPVLSAVAPRHRGWYVRIISELDEYLRSQGAEHSFLITQVTNNAVIRSWEKLGYRFGKGEHVMRAQL